MATTRTSSEITERAAEMAEHICRGFQLHDDGQRRAAEKAFFEVDRRQFAHLTDEEAMETAVCYSDALWAKDVVESQHTHESGEFDVEALRSADWGKVEHPLRERANVVGMDLDYAHQTTLAWKNHKIREDYWTPFQTAQVYELRAALRDSDYPHKPKDGQSGPGPEVARYVLGVELHDMHSGMYWKQAKEIMTPYYAFILEHHEADG